MKNNCFVFSLCLFLSGSLVFVLSGCSSISSVQKNEITEWKSKGLYIEEKNPTTAALLNGFIGLGDFYNGNTGLGVVNFLVWPLSVLWAPIGGFDGALEKNWEVTQISVRQKNPNAAVEAHEYRREPAMSHSKEVLMDDRIPVGPEF